MQKSSWTAADGFSNAQGTDQWFYERPMNQPLVWADGRWQATADIDTPYIGPGVMHPGLVNNRAHDAVLRWDAPYKGTIRITGRVTRREEPRGDGVRARITRNHAKVWPFGGMMADAWRTLAVDDAAGLDHDFCVAVNTGDQIRFVVKWSCFEDGGEGIYDWSWLDRVFSRFEGSGRTFSFRIANYGYWGPTPCDRKYAVPQWVEAAGAQGEIVHANEWRPLADDPIYLEKLTHFLNAMGQHYGSRDDISYIDLGSLGRWGEGHSHPYDLATFEKHWAILENAFPGHQLVVNDDMGPECCDWALDERGAWIRDDSPYRWDPHSFPCMRRARLDRPNIMESRHVVEWQGHEDLPNVPWAMVKEDLETTLSCRSAPVSYAGIHHYPRDFVNNLGQDWVDYWANKMGYWFIVKQVQVPSPWVPNAEVTLELQVGNRGVDRVHCAYRLALALTRVGAETPVYRGPAIASDARGWLPDQTTTVATTWKLGNLPDGEYYLDIALVAPDGDDMRAVVKFGNWERLSNDYLRLGTVRIAGR